MIVRANPVTWQEKLRRWWSENWVVYASLAGFVFGGVVLAQWTTP